jgi:hypothetical protein
MLLVRNIKKCGLYFLSIFLWAVSSVSAHAIDGIFTASIDSKGGIISQSPKWISDVKHYPRTGYFSEYEIFFKAGVLERALEFCSVSVTDVDSYDDLFFGHAKLAGTPTTRSLKVITQLIGGSAKDAGTSKSFMLMCVR